MDGDIMDVASLLSPFFDPTAEQVEKVRVYLELLLKWNARMNLTGLRDPEQIVTRHFGESFFLARQLNASVDDVVDLGSGAGFPGVPLKIARPWITLSLIEAQQRKATFLREVARAINLDLHVINRRAEDVAESQPASASVVTMRAVERFESILPVATQLVRPEGIIALLIGSAQVPLARNLVGNWHFLPEILIPGSQDRVILMGNPDSK